MTWPAPPLRWIRIAPSYVVRCRRLRHHAVGCIKPIFVFNRIARVSTEDFSRNTCCYCPAGASLNCATAKATSEGWARSGPISTAAILASALARFSVGWPSAVKRCKS